MHEVPKCFMLYRCSSQGMSHRFFALGVPIWDAARHFGSCRRSARCVSGLTASNMSDCMLPGYTISCKCTGPGTILSLLATANLRPLVHHREKCLNPGLEGNINELHYALMAGFVAERAAPRTSHRECTDAASRQPHTHTICTSL